MPPIRLKMLIILHNQSALQHFIGKFYMSLGVSADLSATEFTKICCKFRCVGVKNCSEANFFQDLTRAGIQIHARSVFADKIILNR